MIGVGGGMAHGATPLAGGVAHDAGQHLGEAYDAGRIIGDGVTGVAWCIYAFIYTENLMMAV